MKLDEELTEALAIASFFVSVFRIAKMLATTGTNIFAESGAARTFRRETHPRRLSRETLHSRWQSPRRGTSYYISLFSSARPLLLSSSSRPAPPCWYQRKAYRGRIVVESTRFAADRLRHGEGTETRVYPRRRTELRDCLAVGYATGCSGRERLKKGSWWPSGISLAQRPTVCTRPLPAVLSIPSREEPGLSFPPRWNLPRGERTSQSEPTFCLHAMLIATTISSSRSLNLQRMSQYFNTYKLRSI